ncbi:ISXO2-like transposase domain protein (macronuclear) [Tetrahymena thermophila SB210]|uniref:ISXO2-like transposase domain protein n=1 Tax=Tetrahymena thermophila (strain SB210) TaxID=312017 RepID=W7XKA3_TETTS|nr:ISXO2-like transposase domain protein [Tetrahymena thermophila SB210]EWS74754.1 ISXO2-like transposase domain protein [Tetrahymena thermophila SB210]|eukprot:XP_012652755.1 ISXO2-like transposase domain protein [Tetrahymena thermophila SB210]
MSYWYDQKKQQRKQNCFNTNLAVNKETIIPLILQFVSKNSKFIFTDKWHSYTSLKQKGYKHYTVNHSKNFVEHNKQEQQQLQNRRQKIKIIIEKKIIKKCWDNTIHPHLNN